MESFIGFGLAVGLVAVGFVLGLTVQFRQKPVPKPECGMLSALTFQKQSTDAVLSALHAQRQDGKELVERLLNSNADLSDKVLVIADGTLERMRIEKGDPAPVPSGPRPIVDEFVHTDPKPDVFIPNDPNG